MRPACAFTLIELASDATMRCGSVTSCNFAMFPDRQRGIGSIAAIFLVVIVASLAVGVASLVRSGPGYVHEVLSYRAFLAADSGAQLSLNRVFAPEGTPSCNNRVFPFTEPGLEGCEATVSCSAVSVSGVLRYDLESRGRCGSGTEVAERRIAVRASAP